MIISSKRDRQFTKSKGNNVFQPERYCQEYSEKNAFMSLDIRIVTLRFYYQS